ncbi:MAG: AMP-binding protein [Gammaproteobacteria bacterium]|nr:AMP-binding protein [Gammaproteobacteria bacterium]
MMLLEMATSGFGQRIAFTDPAQGASITYQELYDAAGAAAHKIRESGASRVAMLDVSNLAVPIALFASGWANVPYVPINYRLTGEEIDALLARVQPAYLITDPDRLTNFQDRAGVDAVSRQSFLDVARAGGGEHEQRSMDPDDVGVLLFTSGTTGVPKAAVLRHKHLVSYIVSSVEFMSADEDEAALVCVPPYHIAGIAAALSSVYAGRRVVQLANFSADAWIETARHERITTAFVVPTMLSRIVDALEGEKTAGMDHLQSLSYGGGKMPLAVIEKAMALFPDTDFTNAYGLTETSSTITVLGPDEHRIAAASEDPDGRRRLISVGIPLPGIEIEVRDEEGRFLGPEQRGEIHVRGEQVSGEYEDRGSLVDPDGWFPTRDAGFMDADGYLFLDGRADDVIVRGGENMSPGEIEDMLIAHEAVTDAAVVGIPSEEWGEAVASAVVVKSDMPANELLAEALKEWVKAHMRSSRVPEVIEFWGELPYNETGKLLRRVVKDRLTSPKENVHAPLPLLFASDIERSRAFYCDQLGFTLTNRYDPDGKLSWCMLAMEGARIMLEQADSERLVGLTEHRTDIALYFLCEDVDVLHERFTANGVDLEPPFVAFYGMKQLEVRDPDGRFLCFEHPIRDDVDP